MNDWRNTDEKGFLKDLAEEQGGGHKDHLREVLGLPCGRAFMKWFGSPNVILTRDEIEQAKREIIEKY